MNVAHIRDLLTSRYSAVRESLPNVFWVTCAHNGRPVAVRVFDCTDSVGKQGFDLSAYQHTLLSHDYYTDAGPMQWNYYLYFLCARDAYGSLRSTGWVAKIEKDREYARKFVLPEDRLDEELSLTEDSTGQAGVPAPEDISVRWIERLRSVQLDGVFLENAARVQVVERYIAGNPILEAPEAAEPEEKAVAETLTFCESLVISTFRPYPAHGEFALKPVNLIEGPNGAGKTSLLEAIETWICGRTYRNWRDDPSGARIGIRFKGDESVRWNQSVSNELLRARDLAWYGNHYAKGNQLYRGFSRFNFYDSDAGYRLAADPEAGKVDDPLTAIVLGRAASVISDRASKICDLFTAAQSSLSKELLIHNKTVTDASGELAALPTVLEQTQDLRARLLTDARAAGWHGEIQFDDDDLSASSLRGLDETLARIEDCRTHLWWLPSATPSTIEACRQKVKPLVTDIRASERKSQECEQEIARLEEIIESAQDVLVRLDRLQEYVSDLDARRLLGLGHRVAVLQSRVRCLAMAHGQVENMHLTRYEDVDETVVAYSQQLQTSLNTIEQDVSRLEGDLSAIEEQHGKISRLCEEIRSLGSDLLAVDPERSQCPLCGAEYTVGELAQRLEEQLRKTAAIQMLGQLVVNLRGQKAVLEDTQKRFEEIQAVAAAIDILIAGGESVGDQLNECARLLSGLPSSIQELNNALDAEYGLQARLEVKGYSEDELRSLLEWIWSLIPNSTGNYPQQHDLDSLHVQYESRLAQVTEDRQAAQLASQTCKTESEGQLQSYFGLSLPQEPFPELLVRESQLDNAVTQLEQVVPLCPISSDESLSDVSVRIAGVRALYERHQRSVQSLRKSQEARERIQKRIAQATEAVQASETKKERVDRALEVLETILHSDSKEKNLEAVLGDSKGEIERIFRLIHSPREFASIAFGSGKDERLMLVREGSNERSPVSQISSGQRSALALSIFLALNRRLPHGPPVLLFDDPLSYVDDLNILSFLDYLRSIVIRGERQVFFSTANRKIAALFEKKFAFLGDDFVRIELERG